jgi:hypothetical protein
MDTLKTIYKSLGGPVFDRIIGFPTTMTSLNGRDPHRSKGDDNDNKNNITLLEFSQNNLREPPGSSNSGRRVCQKKTGPFLEQLWLSEYQYTV